MKSTIHEYKKNNFKTMSKKLFLLATLATSFVNAQWGSERIVGNGNVITQKRSTPDYDQVSVSGSMDIELIAGKEGELIVTGEENILPYLKTEVVGEDLKIYFENKKNYSHKKKLIITVPFDKISTVKSTGSGDIVGKSIISGDTFTLHIAGSGDANIEVNTASLKTEITGSGDVSVKGKSTNVEAIISGSGDIKCNQVISENAVSRISGSGSISIYASKKINAKVSGSGDIKYYGKPEFVEKKVSGSGTISAN
jgi:Putative auto-transporter adhesin, head GIN domain